PSVRRCGEESAVLRRQRADDCVVSLKAPERSTGGGVESVNVAVVGTEVNYVADANGHPVDAVELEFIALVRIGREDPANDCRGTAVVDQVVVGGAVVLVVVRVVHALGAFFGLLACFGTAFVHGPVPIIVLCVVALGAGLGGHVGVEGGDLAALDGRVDGLPVAGKRRARPALR